MEEEISAIKKASTSSGLSCRLVRKDDGGDRDRVSSEKFYMHIDVERGEGSYSGEIQFSGHGMSCGSKEITVSDCQMNALITIAKRAFDQAPGDASMGTKKRR